MPKDISKVNDQLIQVLFNGTLDVDVKTLADRED